MGRNGNIEITTQELFQSPDSRITASSQLGIDGIVQINTLIAQPGNGILELPQQTIDQSKLVVQACPGNVAGKYSSFTITGCSGKAPTLYDTLEAEPTLPPRSPRNNTQLIPIPYPNTKFNPCSKITNSH